MKLYRLDKRAEAGTSFGSEFFSNRRDAEKASAAWVDSGEEDSETVITEINVALTKSGILRALNRWASHPDNG